RWWTRRRRGRRRGRGALEAFRQAQEIVGLFSVSLGLEVLVPEPTNSDDDPGDRSPLTDVEGPSARFDLGYCGLLRQFPAFATRNTANAMNTLVGIVPIGFVDATNLC